MVIDRDSGRLRRAVAPKSNVFQTCFDDEPGTRGHQDESLSGGARCQQRDANNELWLTRVELVIHAIDARSGRTRYARLFVLIAFCVFV